ncbi:MAG: peptidase M28, partial [Ginsengibacter sp.]
RETFTKWFEPFADLGAKTITISNTGGTDHLGFDAIGLPGFQFIQDPIEYDTRTHHSNMDSYDHLIEDDLKQAATIVAALVYNAAMADQKVPRKELPKAGTGR